MYDSLPFISNGIIAKTLLRAYFSVFIRHFLSFSSFVRLCVLVPVIQRQRTCVGNLQFLIVQYLLYLRYLHGMIRNIAP